MNASRSMRRLRPARGDVRVVLASLVATPACARLDVAGRRAGAAAVLHSVPTRTPPASTEASTSAPSSAALSLAPAGGTVSFVGYVPGSGRAVTITTEDGYAVTLLQLGATSVLRGSEVTEGDEVGVVGESSDSRHAAAARPPRRSPRRRPERICRPARLAADARCSRRLHLRRTGAAGRSLRLPPVTGEIPAPQPAQAESATVEPVEDDVAARPRCCRRLPASASQDGAACRGDARRDRERPRKAAHRGGRHDRPGSRSRRCRPAAPVAGVAAHRARGRRRGSPSSRRKTLRGELPARRSVATPPARHRGRPGGDPHRLRRTPPDRRSTGRGARAAASAADARPSERAERGPAALAVLLLAALALAAGVAARDRRQACTYMNRR